MISTVFTTNWIGFGPLNENWPNRPKDFSRTRPQVQGPSFQGQKDKDLKFVLKEFLRTRTRTRTNIPDVLPDFRSYVQLLLYSKFPQHGGAMLCSRQRCHFIPASRAGGTQQQRPSAANRPQNASCACQCRLLSEPTRTDDTRQLGDVTVTSLSGLLQEFPGWPRLPVVTGNQFIFNVDCRSSR